MSRDPRRSSRNLPSESFHDDASQSLERDGSVPILGLESQAPRASTSTSPFIKSPPGYPPPEPTVRRSLGSTIDYKVETSPNPLAEHSSAPAGSAPASELLDGVPADLPDGAAAAAAATDSSELHLDEEDEEAISKPPARKLPAWDLWADHDKGATGLQVTRGYSSSANASELILLATGQIPVDILGRALRKVGGCKEELGSIYRIASVFAKYRSDICDPLIEATKHRGAECRSMIDQAASLLFGSENVHCAVCYAIMITIWNTNPKSAKADTIAAVLTDYMHTADFRVEDLIAYTTKGRTLNVAVETRPAHILPGMIRLDPYRRHDFGLSWRDLWTCCVNVLCGIIHSGEVDEAIKAWEIISSNHPLVAKRGELVQSVLARHLTAINHISTMADRFNASCRKPDAHRQGGNFLKAFVFRKNNARIIREIRARGKVFP